jgi:hypothetical protein
MSTQDRNEMEKPSDGILRRSRNLKMRAEKLLKEAEEMNARPLIQQEIRDLISVCNWVLNQAK